MREAKPKSTSNQRQLQSSKKTTNIKKIKQRGKEFQFNPCVESFVPSSEFQMKIYNSSYPSLPSVSKCPAKEAALSTTVADARHNGTNVRIQIIKKPSVIAVERQKEHWMSIAKSVASADTESFKEDPMYDSSNADDSWHDILSPSQSVDNNHLYSNVDSENSHRLFVNKIQNPSSEQLAHWWQALMTGDIKTIELILDSNLDNIKLIECISMDYPGLSSLHVAAQLGLDAVLCQLLTAVANTPSLEVDCKDQTRRKCTPLHYACEVASSRRPGHMTCVFLLLQAGADPSCTDRPGHNCLHKAVLAGNFSLVQYLFSAQVHRGQLCVDAADRKGRTALMMTKSKNILWLLLSKGADPSLLNHEGYNCLCEAARNGDFRLLAVFLQGNSNARASNVTGTFGSYTATQVITSRSPLHLAAKHGHIKCLEILLTSQLYDDEINLLDSESSFTPLMYASSIGNSDMAELLLKNSNCCSTVEDQWGRIALTVAGQAGHLDTVRVMLAARPNDSSYCNIINSKSVLRLLVKHMEQMSCDVSRRDQVACVAAIATCEGHVPITNDILLRLASRDNANILREIKFQFKQFPTTQAMQISYSTLTCDGWRVPLHLCERSKNVKILTADDSHVWAHELVLLAGYPSFDKIMATKDWDSNKVLNLSKHSKQVVESYCNDWLCHRVDCCDVGLSRPLQLANLLALAIEVNDCALQRRCQHHIGLAFAWARSNSKEENLALEWAQTDELSILSSWLKSIKRAKYQPSDESDSELDNDADVAILMNSLKSASSDEWNNATIHWFINNNASDIASSGTSSSSSSTLRQSWQAVQAQLCPSTGDLTCGVNAMTTCFTNLCRIKSSEICIGEASLDCPIVQSLFDNNSIKNLTTCAHGQSSWFCDDTTDTSLLPHFLLRYRGGLRLFARMCSTCDVELRASLSAADGERCVYAHADILTASSDVLAAMFRFDSHCSLLSYTQHRHRIIDTNIRTSQGMKNRDLDEHGEQTVLVLNIQLRYYVLYHVVRFMYTGEVPDVYGLWLNEQDITGTSSGHSTCSAGASAVIASACQLQHATAEYVRFLIDLTHAADHFLMTELKTQLEILLLRHLTADNCWELYVLACDTAMAKLQVVAGLACIMFFTSSSYQAHAADKQEVDSDSYFELSGGDIEHILISLMESDQL